MRGLRCDICSHTNGSYQRMWLHLARSHGAAPLPSPEEAVLCDQCGRAFYEPESRKNLFHHDLNVHKADMRELLRCDTCHESLSSPLILSSHLGRIHCLGPLKATAFCDECGIPFAGSLHCHAIFNHFARVHSRHLTAWTRVRKAFNENMKAQDHSRRKLPSAIHFCDDCEHRVTSRSHLVAHLRRCNMQRLRPATRSSTVVRCELCSTPHRKTDLWSHFIVNHGHRGHPVVEMLMAARKARIANHRYRQIPLHCDDCGRVFHGFGNLYVHFEARHAPDLPSWRRQKEARDVARIASIKVRCDVCCFLANYKAHLQKHFIAEHA